ncbi:hypothetical protein [Duganella sp. SG902]
MLAFAGIAGYARRRAWFGAPQTDTN